MAPSLRAVAVTFVVFGVFWGGWAVAAADIERELELSHGGFGTLLSVALLGGALANVVGGELAERRGTTAVLALSLAAWGVLLALGGAVRSPAGFAAVFIAIVAVGGLVDVAMNVAATAALADRPGDLVRFHGLFNAGAAIGAALTGLLIADDVSWRWTWGLAAAGAAVLGAVHARSARGGRAVGGDVLALRGVIGLLRRERLVMVAVAFAVGAMVEGGVELWGVLFLRTHLSEGLAVGATSAVIGYAVATLARLLLGPVVGGRGAARGVTLGAATAAAGLVVTAASDVAVLAGLGYVLAAGGISMCWPLLLSHAGAGRERAGAIVGAVSSVGYLGFVFGPTVVGWVADGVGLRGGLVVLAAGAVFVAAVPVRIGLTKPTPPGEPRPPTPVQPAR